MTKMTILKNSKKESKKFSKRKLLKDKLFKKIKEYLEVPYPIGQGNNEIINAFQKIRIKIKVKTIKFLKN